MTSDVSWYLFHASYSSSTRVNSVGLSPEQTMEVSTKVLGIFKSCTEVKEQLPGAKTKVHWAPGPSASVFLMGDFSNLLSFCHQSQFAELHWHSEAENIFVLTRGLQMSLPNHMQCFKHKILTSRTVCKEVFQYLLDEKQLHFVHFILAIR